MKFEDLKDGTLIKIVKTLPDDLVNKYYDINYYNHICNNNLIGRVEETQYGGVIIHWYKNLNDLNNNIIDKFKGGSQI